MRFPRNPALLAASILAVAFTPGARRLAALTEVAKPTLDMSIYGHVVQIGWVVKDLDRVVSYWEKLGLRNINRAGVLEFPDNTYRGRITLLRLKMAFGKIGDVRIEWIEPVGGNSAFNEFLRKHGDGVYALAYRAANPSQLEKQIEYFKSQSVDVVEEGSWEGAKGRGRYAYLDTARQGGGLALELVYNPDAPAQGAPAPSENQYPFNRLTQYALVVRDVKKVGAYYESLGFGGMPVEHNVSVNRTYRGKPGKFEMYLGWGSFGDVMFEWIQSLVGPSVYDEYLKAHGEGLHHLAFQVRDMDQAIALLGSKGAPVSQSGGWDTPGGKGRFAYLDSEPYGGVTIELLWNQPR